jgi:hypothetical protein
MAAAIESFWPQQSVGQKWAKPFVSDSRYAADNASVAKM